MDNDSKTGASMTGHAKCEDMSSVSNRFKTAQFLNKDWTYDFLGFRQSSFTLEAAMMEVLAKEASSRMRFQVRIGFLRKRFEMTMAPKYWQSTCDDLHAKTSDFLLQMHNSA